MLNILNLGAGVQSTTVLLKSCLGELPKLDCAIFADTGWEPKEVYKHLDWLAEFAAGHGVPVHRVSCGRNIRTDAIWAQVRGKKESGNRGASMPYYTKAPGDEKEGQIKRQCTSDYKIVPIERFVKKEILGLSQQARWPKDLVVRRWYGISADEAGRIRAPVRTSKKKTGVDLLGQDVYEQVVKPLMWCSNFYPLIGGIELFGDVVFGKVGVFDCKKVPGRQSANLPMVKRRDCLDWCKSHGFPTPPRSACIGCPYHDDIEWLHLKTSSPDEFEDACQFDDAIRNCGGMCGQMFLHRSCKPLREIEFSGEHGGGVCESGFCFV